MTNLDEDKVGRFSRIGRSERIRTSDPLLPKQVRYQAALRSDTLSFIDKQIRLRKRIYPRRSRKDDRFRTVKNTFLKALAFEGLTKMGQ